MTSASKSKQDGTGEISEESETVQKFYTDDLEIKVILVEGQVIQYGMILHYKGVMVQQGPEGGTEGY